jgi:transcriptional regulator with XRE-family HTH domain
MKNNDMNAEIGRWLRHQRELKGMSQQDVADRLGTTRTAVHYWESGKRTIYAVNFIDYCEVLGVDPQQAVDDLKGYRS